MYFSVELGALKACRKIRSTKDELLDNSKG